MKLGGGKGLLAYTSSSRLVVEGSQSRNQEAETEAEATDTGCLLACPPSLCPTTFFILPGPPVQGCNDPWRAELSHIYKENETCLQVHLMESFSY